MSAAPWGADHGADRAADHAAGDGADDEASQAVGQVCAPAAGTVRALAQAPDPVFAAEMVGAGVAIEPDLDREGGPVQALAPVTGTVLTVHPHAAVVVTAAGAGVLVHLGIDTVELAGEGFEVHLAKGEPVTAGAPMITWDPAAVAAGGRSPMVLVCLLDTAPGTVTSARLGQRVEAGEALFALP